MEGLQALTIEENNKAFKAKIMEGDFEASTQVGKRLLRVFISSTFKDTIAERNYLMCDIYPKIREFCNLHGIKFVPVDLRWGIGKHEMDDYKITDVCLAEVDRCFQDSIPGPCFVFMSFNRYGSQPLPRRVDKKEFETILGLVDDPELKEIINSCYREDKNAIPSEYILKSRNKQLEQFPEAKTEDEKYTLWREKRAKMHKAIRGVLERTPDIEEEAKLKWLISVTESEVRQAFCKQKEVSKRCFALKRDIIMENETGAEVSTFIDGFEENRKKLRQLLSIHRIPTEEFTVRWTSNGINQSSHSDYFQLFGEKFFSFVENMVEDTVKMLPNLDALTSEVAAHLTFCCNRAQNFFGREDMVKKAEKYFYQPDGGKCLFVIFGVSGSGKTSLVAKLAERAYHYFRSTSVLPAAKETRMALRPSRPVVIVRFCGTSPESSTAYSIMKSICEQIFCAFNIKDTIMPVNYEETIKIFSASLKLATKDAPLVILIDSLDQLSNVNNGRSDLKWIPGELPPHVYFIVSTVVGFGGCYENLQAKKLSPDCYFKVQSLADSDCDIILDNWLKATNRTLTDDQRTYILSIAKDKTLEEPSTIRLRLLYQISLECASYHKLKKLPIKTVDLIANFLERVEDQFGALLVSTLFGLLDTSKRGLDESDLLDILSCKDSVLNEALTDVEAPIPRIPQVVLSRLRYRFGEYVVERGAYGKRVLAWYHRQFWETANKRYINPGKVTEYAEDLKRFFSGEFHKSYPERLISNQPLFWKMNHDESILYNEQKLLELPWAAIRGTCPASVEDIICDFHFILAMLKAGFFEELFRDFSDAIRFCRSEKLLEFERFLTQDASEMFPDEVVQRGLKQPTDSVIYQAAMEYNSSLGDK